MKFSSLLPSKFKRVYQFNCSRKEIRKIKRKLLEDRNIAERLPEMPHWKCQNTFFFFFLFCFNMSFPFTDANVSQENIERERTLFSFLFHSHSFTNIQRDICSYFVRDTYLASLISVLITRSLLNEALPGQIKSISINVRYSKFLTNTR